MALAAGRMNTSRPLAPAAQRTSIGGWMTPKGQLTRKLAAASALDALQAPA